MALDCEEGLSMVGAMQGSAELPKGLAMCAYIWSLAEEGPFVSVAARRPQEGSGKVPSAGEYAMARPWSGCCALRPGNLAW